MPFIIPAGFAQSTLHFTSFELDSPEAVVVLGFDNTPADLAGLGNSIKTHFLGSLASQLSSAFILNKIVTIDATNVDENDANITGLLGSADTTVDNALLQKKLSGFRGKHNQGRSYWPGFLKAAQVGSDGSIDSSRLTDLTTRFGTFFNSIATDGWAPVILHKDGSAPRAITAFQFEDRAAVQRRRMGR